MKTEKTPASHVQFKGEKLGANERKGILSKFFWKVFSCSTCTLLHHFCIENCVVVYGASTKAHEGRQDQIQFLIPEEFT